MEIDPRDPSIEQLEADLQASRFQKWEVEVFLEKRHKAKIEKLNQVEGRRAIAWAALKELILFVFAYLGFAGLLAFIGLGLLVGAWPPLEVVSLP